MAPARPLEAHYYADTAAPLSRVYYTVLIYVAGITNPRGWEGLGEVSDGDVYVGS